MTFEAAAQADEDAGQMLRTVAQMVYRIAAVIVAGEEIVQQPEVEMVEGGPGAVELRTQAPENADPNYSGNALD